MSLQLQTPARIDLRLQPWQRTGKGFYPRVRYALDWSSVTLAAIAAALAMTIYMMNIPRLLGVPMMDIGITIGGMVDPSGGLGAWLVRVAWHMGHGVAYVPVYAMILLRRQRQSSAGTGAAFGIFLWLAGPMLLIPIVLSRPIFASCHLSHPGIFMLTLGLGMKPALIDLVAHLTHGIIAGTIYKHRRVFED